MLRNYWYIACAAIQLQTEPRATRVLDQQLVLFRDTAGLPHALLDRCCHRGVPLSLGEVVEGALACRYHGWRYDGTGTCVHIPSLTTERRMPQGYAVPMFPCLEQDGYIWVWMGAPAHEPTYRPSLPLFTQYRWLQGAQEWRCAALHALENSLDWCHPAFAHPDTHRQARMVQQYGFREQAYEMRLLPQGLVVFAPPTASADAPIPAQLQTLLRFDFPDRILVSFPQSELCVIKHVVPTGVNTCRVEWLLHHAGLTGAGVMWAEEEPEIFAQDRRLLEGAQLWYDTAGDEFERSVEADASTLMLRRMMDLAAQGRWETERAGLRQRRIVAVRA
jgi:nitrite reductase/ring-hydroxylating ferredoxin subunit